MNEAAEYEILAQRIATELSSFFGVLTQRCEVRVVLPGYGTSNEIDVLWVGKIDGADHRILIECKHYNRTVDQGKLHAFRSVVDDIVALDQVPTTGVFVTTQGYQSGAQSLATVYGIVVLELRPPTPEDLAGRVTQIVIDIVGRTEVVDDVRVEADWVDQSALPESQVAVNVDATWVDFPDGSYECLRETLTAGERSPLGEPATPPHVVTREFPAGVFLRIDGRRVLRAQRITAIVGDSDSKATHTIGPGPEGIAHVLRDAITGATVWFEEGGAIRVVH